MPVKKGDFLRVIDSATVTHIQVHIIWQQSLQSRSQDYYIVTYTNITRASEDEHSGLLYIQKDMLDDFRAKHVPGEKGITFIVDDTFQYGQDTTHSHRWLAFHDKSQKMYQNRFFERMGSVKFSDAVIEMADKDEYLRDF
ncbi:uncharacterized protein LACBIDRAFT_310976 [Laccaria bicolor S238N-H82]|uniref:Predicted protein n=1 Tax=Laccaria bicolor (strain S238N-H82 / ATCC MYA-4686) TaxID=486041 RepID=B0DVG7_LACBS|nr:uncharacterized protein LACBIDRAFT_310976 [Laccaria bicolor S238N-H82]EDR01380.1 predicted protein [Laccaria bicolor S238N-H82]|eukprot:XP_001887925.1 predicted protein [Laccaria bicolor S238N-H82]